MPGACSQGQQVISQHDEKPELGRLQVDSACLSVADGWIWDMPVYADQIRPAKLVLAALSTMVLEDLGPQGGISWWRDLDAPRSILIADYLVGLTHSTASNLEQTVMHRDKLKSAWTTEGMRLGARIRAGQGKPEMLSQLTDQDQNRSVEIDAHLSGFFRATGSVLDTLVGLIVGTAGLATPLVRADWAIVRKSADEKKVKTFLTGTDGGRRAQLDLLERVRVLAADGGDWLDWTLDFRNTQVHRATRTTLMMRDPKRATGIVNPLPRHPAQTEGESLAITYSRAIEEAMLTEDALDTLNFIFHHLHELTVQVTRLCVNVWQTRRDDPVLIAQPSKQWPKLLQGDQRHFAGAVPDGRLPRGNTMLVGPEGAMRLQRGLFLDEHRRTWQRWLNEDAEESQASSPK
ncbi:hypothetical protein [Promicromonospora iranensis]|uniref:hypothetical protein n=1 Tax=Promicromonospora iranensis TaxID=1105144 RepID=UPI0023AA0C19|nr:hypothetical protein [Promicromonospora iranensis]